MPNHCTSCLRSVVDEVPQLTGTVTLALLASQHTRSQERAGPALPTRITVDAWFAYDVERGHVFMRRRPEPKVHGHFSEHFDEQLKDSDAAPLRNTLRAFLSSKPALSFPLNTTLGGVLSRRDAQVINARIFGPTGSDQADAFHLTVECEAIYTYDGPWWNKGNGIHSGYTIRDAQLHC